MGVEYALGGGVLWRKRILILGKLGAIPLCIQSFRKDSESVGKLPTSLGPYMAAQQKKRKVDI